MTAATFSPAPLPLLRRLHQRGRLLPLLRSAATEEAVVAAALDAGLSVTDAELQDAADTFRQRHGLMSAAETTAWLGRDHLTAQDLQEAFEADLLTAKFQDHLAARHGPDHFAAHAARYARARLRLLVAASEGEASEWTAQVNDGRDFAELARRHSLHLASRPAGGDLGEVFRCHLPVRAADAVFLARPGTLAGPFPGEGGFCLFLVEGHARPEYAAAASLIRAEVFDAWLRRRLADLRLDLSWLGTQR